MIFYLKLIAMWVWAISITLLYTLLLPFRWGDTNLLRNWVRAIGGGVLKLAGIELEIENEELLWNSRPCIFMANHQSALDVVVFGRVVPKDTVVIAKYEVLLIPFIGLIFLAGRAIFLKRKERTQSIEQLNKAVHLIKKYNLSIAIAPEGTRNKEGHGLLPFKKGGFHLALQANVPIVPVLCSPQAEVANWKNKRLPGGRLRIKVLPPISPSALSLEELMEVVRSKMLEIVSRS